MLNYLLSMIMLTFSVATIIAGIFTAYFGSGKSRIVGSVLIIFGLVVGVVFLWFAGNLSFLGTAPYSFGFIILESIIAVIGAIIGALIALGIFLLAIMKA